MSQAPGRTGSIRALVIDDSAAMRGLIMAALRRDPRIEVIGGAGDPFQAREAIKQLAPDVVTLDVEMPGMSGLEFLERLMRLRPMPVVMVSSLTSAGAEASIRALELGAVDCVPKPSPETPHSLDDLAGKVIAAASARLRRTAPRPQRPSLQPQQPAYAPDRCSNHYEATMPYAKHLNVMVVDDTSVSRALICAGIDELGIQGYRIARDGEEVLKLLIANPAHLVLSDLNMPKLDGLGLLRALREYTPTSKIGFIIVTGRDDICAIDQARRLGLNNFKPFTTPGLRACIEAVTGKLV